MQFTACVLKITICAALGLSLIFPAPASAYVAPSPQFKLQHYKRQAENLVQQEDYLAALKPVQAAITLNPNALEGQLLWGLIQMHLGNYEAALSKAQDILNLNPDEAQAYNLLGLIYAEKSELRAALRNYNHAIALAPDFYEAFNNRGLVYYQLAKFQKAFNDFAKCMQHAPNLVNLEQNYEQAKKALTADNHAQSLNAAISANPLNANGYVERAEYYLNLGRYDLALQDLHQALSINPFYSKAYYLQGIIYYEAGDLDKARDNFFNASKFSPVEPAIDG